LANIPDDVKVQAALAKMIPIVSYAPRTEVSKKYKKLAGDLIGEKEKKKSLVSKVKKAVKKRKDTKKSKKDKKQ